MRAALQHDRPRGGDPGWRTPAPGPRRITRRRRRVAFADAARPSGTGHQRGRYLGEVKMILLIDIGNTHTHLGLANRVRVFRQTNMATSHWFGRPTGSRIRRFVGRAVPEGAALCSVVPRATPFARRALKRLWNISPLELTSRTVRGVGIRYPKPETIGPDRLANAVAARHHFGAPAVVVDFGTGVALGVVGPRGDYGGGII